MALQNRELWLGAGKQIRVLLSQGEKPDPLPLMHMISLMAKHEMTNDTSGVEIITLLPPQNPFIFLSACT
jgi:hypothetical protein